jgi:phage repressor protein C with HTH and peptisase S24 domain
MWVFLVHFYTVTDSDEIFTIIEDRRKELGLSQAQVSMRAFNRNDTSAIQNIKRGSVPSFEKLSAISRVLGLECYFGIPRNEADAITQIMDTHGEPAAIAQIVNDHGEAAQVGKIVESTLEPDTTQSDKNEYTLVTLHNVQAAAGAGRVNDHPEPPSALAFNNIWLNLMGLTPGKSSLIYVAGDSMEPTLKDGAIVLIDHKQTDPGGKHIYVVRDGDELVVKRLEKPDAKTLLLSSDNPDYDTKVLTGIDLKSIDIVGKVVWSAFAVSS